MACQSRVLPTLAIEAQDHHGKWAGKMSDWQEGVIKGAPAYLENHRFDAMSFSHSQSSQRSFRSTRPPFKSLASLLG